LAAFIFTTRIEHSLEHAASLHLCHITPHPLVVIDSGSSPEKLFMASAVGCVIQVGAVGQHPGLVRRSVSLGRVRHTETINLYCTYPPPNHCIFTPWQGQLTPPLCHEEAWEPPVLSCEPTSVVPPQLLLASLGRCPSTYSPSSLAYQTNHLAILLRGQIITCSDRVGT
jgi:hypothetical protein